MANVTELNRKPDISANAIDAAEVSAADVFGNAVYPTIEDIPTEFEAEGNMAYTESDGLVVFEA